MHDSRFTGSELIADARHQVQAVEDKIKWLGTMTVTVQIALTGDRVLARQIFADVADNALGISRSILSAFSTRSAFNRVAQELSEKNLSGYRAAPPKWDIAACSEYEGQIRPVQEVYDGHRARYWPPPGDLEADSIPFQPGCHHTIKRI